MRSTFVHRSRHPADSSRARWRAERVPCYRQSSLPNPARDDRAEGRIAGGSGPQALLTARKRWRSGDSTTAPGCSSTVGTTEVLTANLAPAAPLANYVSTGGELRIRSRCTRSSPSFFASDDFLQVTYDQP